MKVSPTCLSIVLAGAWCVTVGCQSTIGTPEERAANAYTRAIQKTRAMPDSLRAGFLARQHGLEILNLTWEDTSRYKNSAVGGNISDMTIQAVQIHPDREDEIEVSAMPVIRYPNFSDKTADLDPRDFTLLVGNEKGSDLKRLSLYEFLENPTRYLSRPSSWSGSKRKTLLASRDSKVLVSAQACLLPIPKEEKAVFNPVIFNYQSGKKNPAVLTLLATREGTSVTVIDNTRDAFDGGAIWGQRLFHNENGQRANLTGERESDFIASETLADREGSTGAQAPGAEGLNIVLLVQVPLKQKKPAANWGGKPGDYGFAYAPAESFDEPSDVENAVIGHGDLEGPFTEIDDLSIERDARYPVRVTVQFYKATSNGSVNRKDMRAIAENIGRVYRQATDVGSLVTGGRTGRITEYEGAKTQPADWWERFWQRHEASTGESRQQAREKLIRLLGGNYRARRVTDLYLRDLLKAK